LSHDQRLSNQWKYILAIEHDVFIENDHEAAVKKAEEMLFGIAIVHSEVLTSDIGSIAPFVKTGLKSLIIGPNWPENKQIDALTAGCHGYCEVDIAPDLLLKAVSSILKGDVWIPRHLIPQVIGRLAKLPPVVNESAYARNQLKRNLDLLTHREVDVVKMLGEGLSNKAIASKLNISDRTVKAHLTSIFQKLDVQDRLQLALLIRDSF